MRMSSSAIAVLLSVAWGRGAPVEAQSRPASVSTASIQAMIDSVLAANADIPSIAVHLESPRLHLSWTGFAGYADPATKRPLGPRHAVRMASNTKTYIAAAILRLWEHGKLGLDDPIAKHLSAQYQDLIAKRGYDPNAITVRHLLSHTSGLYDYAMDTVYAARVGADPTHRWTRLEQLQAAMSMGDPYGLPGEVYHYADTGYILLGEIIERTTGLALGPALGTLLGYRRLGLASTWLETLEPKPAAVLDRAHQFQREVDTYGFDPSLDLYGGGGLAATTRDMAVFTRALFAGLVFARPTTIDTMITRVPAKKLLSYRLGIGEGSVEGFRSYGHTGYWNTSSQYFPDLDLAVAIAVQQNAKYQVAGPLLREVIRRLRPDRAALTTELQGVLDRLVASDSTIPGVSVHLESTRLALTWSAAAGVGNRSDSKPLRPDQPMRMASNTKTYTAAAILRLQENGKLSIDDPIARYLPASLVEVLRKGGYEPAGISIRTVLHHTSGLYDYGIDSAYSKAVTDDPAHRWTRFEQVQFAMDHGRPKGPPGQVFHYSDTGYILLGEIVERLTGLTLGAAFRSLLDYDRHHLYATWLETIDPSPWVAENRAHQYFAGVDTYRFDPSIDLYGGGGLVAPPKDMAIFMRDLVRGQVFRRPRTIAVMLERPTITAERDYRMGIYRNAVDSLDGFGHTGFWGTFAFYYPGPDLAVAGSITEHFAGRRIHQLIDDLVRATVKRR